MHKTGCQPCPRCCAPCTATLACIASNHVPIPQALADLADGCVAGGTLQSTQSGSRTCGPTQLAARHAILRKWRRVAANPSCAGGPPQAGCPWLRQVRRLPIELKAPRWGWLEAAAAPPHQGSASRAQGGAAASVGSTGDQGLWSRTLIIHARGGGDRPSRHEHTPVGGKPAWRRAPPLARSRRPEAS